MPERRGQHPVLELEPRHDLDHPDFVRVACPHEPLGADRLDGVRALSAETNLLVTAGAAETLGGSWRALVQPAMFINQLLASFDVPCGGIVVRSELLDEVLDGVPAAEVPGPWDLLARLLEHEHEAGRLFELLLEDPPRAGQRCDSHAVGTGTGRRGRRLLRKTASDAGLWPPGSRTRFRLMDWRHGAPLVPSRQIGLGEPVATFIARGRDRAAAPAGLVVEVLPSIPPALPRGSSTAVCVRFDERFSLAAYRDVLEPADVVRCWWPNTRGAADRVLQDLGRSVRTGGILEVVNPPGVWPSGGDLVSHLSWSLPGAFTLVEVLPLVEGAGQGGPSGAEVATVTRLRRGGGGR